MHKGSIIALAVVACGLALWGGWALRGTQGHADAAAGAIDDGTGRQAVAAAATPASGPAAAPQRLESRAERVARLAAQREEQRDMSRKVVAAGRQNLESRFRSEKPNPGWARAKEAELERYVVNPQMDAIDAVPTDFNVECKASTCRIEAEFANPSAADDWATLYLTNNGGTLPRSSLTKVRQPDGTVKLVMVGSTI